MAKLKRMFVEDKKYEKKESIKEEVVTRLQNAFNTGGLVTSPNSLVMKPKAFSQNPTRSPKKRERSMIKINSSHTSDHTATKLNRRGQILQVLNNEQMLKSLSNSPNPSEQAKSPGAKKKKKAHAAVIYAPKEKVKKKKVLILKNTRPHRMFEKEEVVKSESPSLGNHVKRLVERDMASPDAGEGMAEDEKTKKFSYQHCMRDMIGPDIKTYLHELHSNVPDFDDCLPRFDKPPDPWNNIYNHILTPFSGENQKFIQYIKKYSEYRDQLESDDYLINMVLTKKGHKNLQDRLVHFPFTYFRVKQSELKQLNEKHRESMN